VPLKLSRIEEEVVFLKATLESINSMVNFGLMSLHGTDPESSILFKTSAHQQLFNITLVDFLSRTDRRGPVQQNSYVGALRHIAGSPHFSVDDSVAPLRTAVGEFMNWLDAEITVNVWFPSIETQTPLSVARVQYIKMTGDLSKHNLLRAVGVAEDLQHLLAKQGVNVELEAALLALDDFYEWFHDNILNYHASTLAGFLNELRWAIHDYLAPEFSRSIVWLGGNPPAYKYTYPVEIASKFGQENYWALMNLVRSEPYMRRFQVTKWLKLRY
jgi:hypothetical protein